VSAFMGMFLKPQSDREYICSVLTVAWIKLLFSSVWNPSMTSFLMFMQS
jgi:hypothetical protein